MNGNVIVMSEAGKPIFARYGSQGEVARQCGLVQALRTAINGNNSFLGLGEIQSIHSKKLCIVFMTVGSITLVNILQRTEREAGNFGIGVVDTEAFGRLQLEYVYASLIFILTTNVQSTFMHNPGFDLRAVIKSNDNLLRGILDQSAPDGNPAPFLVSCVQSCFPLSHKIRHNTSKILQSIAGRSENNVAFALLIVGDKLVSVVQPSYRPHQLRISDLHLVINFIEKQPNLNSSELWIPMCLPRFNSTGFLYAYANCFDITSKLTLVLLSSHNTTEQFRILRTASREIRESLNISPALNTVLNIVNNEPVSSSSCKHTPSSDVVWKRTSESFDNSSTTDEGFVNISADMLGKDCLVVEEGNLLHQVRHSLELSLIDYIRSHYLKDEDSLSLLHFLFRMDVPVGNSLHKNMHRKKQSGYLPQCVSPPVTEPFNTISSRRRLWNNYQKLSLRLRLGSATVESCSDAFDMIKNDSCTMENDRSGFHAFTGIGSDCPAIGLTESAPYNSDGLSYIMEGDSLFLAMNGKNFEL